MNNIILVINDITTEEIARIQPKIRHANQLGTELSLLYVKPYLPTCYFHVPSMVALAEELSCESKQELKAIGTQLDVPATRQWIATGHVKNEASKLAEKLDATFILASEFIFSEVNKPKRFEKFEQTRPIESVAQF